MSTADRRQGYSPTRSLHAAHPLMVSADPRESSLADPLARRKRSRIAVLPTFYDYQSTDRAHKAKPRRSSLLSSDMDSRHPPQLLTIPIAVRLLATIIAFRP